MSELRFNPENYNSTEVTSEHQAPGDLTLDVEMAKQRQAEISILQHYAATDRLELDEDLTDIADEVAEEFSRLVEEDAARQIEKRREERRREEIHDPEVRAIVAAMRVGVRNRSGITDPVSRQYY